jgi:predicted nucleotidyltransferase component of viral defense system
MLDINKHRFYLFQILKDVYSDPELAVNLGFKGGTALMFFYDLPRFSVDLDFNLLNPATEETVYQKVRQIILNYGSIHDEAKKHFGPLVVLDYEVGERKLKVEISKRNFNDRYEIKNLLGVNIKVMTASDMFAHKLCALTDRGTLSPRDVFDSWFFMNNKTPVNINTIESRMRKDYKNYMQQCIEQVSQISEKKLIQGLGELLTEDMKKFVKRSLKQEALHLLQFYRDYPIV